MAEMGGPGNQDERRMRRLRDAFDRFAGECMGDDADPVEVARYFRGFASDGGPGGGRPLAVGGTVSDAVFYGMASLGEEDAALVCAWDADRMSAPMWLLVWEGAVSGPFGDALDAASAAVLEMCAVDVGDALGAVRCALHALCRSVRGTGGRTPLAESFGTLGISPADGLARTAMEWAGLQGVAEAGAEDLEQAMREFRERAGRKRGADDGCGEDGGREHGV